MNPAFRDVSDDDFFDSESRSLAFHQMRKPTFLDVVGLTALLGAALAAAGAIMIYDKVRGLFGR